MRRMEISSVKRRPNDLDPELTRRCSERGLSFSCRRPARRRQLEPGRWAPHGAHEPLEVAAHRYGEPAGTVCRFDAVRVRRSLRSKRGISRSANTLHPFNPETNLSVEYVEDFVLGLVDVQRRRIL